MGTITGVNIGIRTKADKYSRRSGTKFVVMESVAATAGNMSSSTVAGTFWIQYFNSLKGSEGSSVFITMPVSEA
jgi:hypothetical protein